VAPQVVELEVPLMIQDNRLTTHLTLRELACITQSTHLEDLQMEEVGNQLQDLVILKAIKIKDLHQQIEQGEAIMANNIVEVQGHLLCSHQEMVQ
jgi:hypothetical protein